MKIHEYQARGIFRHHGLPVPDFEVVSEPAAARRAAERFGGRVAVKAQVHVGGRGKAGGVKIADSADEAQEAAEAILGMDLKGLTVRKVLVERAVEYTHEYYVGVVIDRGRKKPVLMVSDAGGVDIETVARETPEKIHKQAVDLDRGLKAEEALRLASAIEERPEIARRIAECVSGVFEAFVESDASLAEINPLVATGKGEVVAIDAKILLDDNALFRHPDLAAMRDPDSETELARKAREMGLSYVKLDGVVGCIVNGAGLAMTTMDLIKKRGGEPANFLDIGGSSDPAKVLTALGIITSDANVRSILVNIFGGITRCDDVARGLLQAFEKIEIDVPVVVRLTGTNEEEARELLAASDLATADSMDEAVEKAVALAGEVAA
ncbi:MAG: ADP-forming succinate--CoA ligase subunit beta [Candidatus Eisenbacteria bacterium]|nr:ADP-forming succinate--CoA ligase subunit beta [Candidatus Eisenbacteria bacterium]